MPDGTVLGVRERAGDGPAVVLLHGLAGSGRELLPTAEALGPRHVVLLDQRGHGGSTRVPADASRAAFVADVVAVIERLDAGPVDLVGQSMGAHTAMLVASCRPELVRRLVLLEADAGSATTEAAADLEAWFASWPTPFADTDAAREALGDGALARAWIDDLEPVDGGLAPRFDAAVMGAVLASMTPHAEEWRTVRAPTLAVYADGGMFSPEQQRAFVAAGHDARRLGLTGASHDAHLDAPDAWVEALRAFLER